MPSWVCCCPSYNFSLCFKATHFLETMRLRERDGVSVESWRIISHYGWVYIQKHNKEWQRLLGNKKDKDISTYLRVVVGEMWWSGAILCFHKHGSFLQSWKSSEHCPHDQNIGGASVVSMVLINSWFLGNKREHNS
jgi:hypothetical protein